MRWWRWVRSKSNPSAWLCGLFAEGSTGRSSSNPPRVPSPRQASYTGVSAAQHCQCDQGKALSEELAPRADPVPHLLERKLQGLLDLVVRPLPGGRNRYSPAAIPEKCLLRGPLWPFCFPAAPASRTGSLLGRKIPGRDLFG